MRFVQVLRERGLGRTDRSVSGIPLPPGRKFTPEEWTAAYEAFGDGSAEDRNAFEAGLFLWERMERVRDELLKMGQYIATFPGSDRVTGLCGFMNAFQKRPGNADHQHQEGMELAIEHALTDRALGEFPGDRYTVAEALQGMIDGAKLPLRHAIAGVRLGVPTPIEPLIDHERALFNEMALGRIYESFESAWQGVQWSGARLHRRGLEYLFDETGDLRSVESRLDVFRRTQRFTRDSDEMAPIVERRTNSAKRVPVPEGISLTACRIADLAPEVRHHVSAVQNQRATTTALEIEPFERVIHPRFEIPISKVIDVWSHLAVIASCCLWQARERPADTVQPGLPFSADARRFSKAHLAEVIAQCAELDDRRVAQVLDRFTFSLGPDGGKQDELWDRPLVPSGDDLILVWHPLMACEYTRLIARLASEAPQLRDAHATKGHHFEERVVEVLQLAAARSPAQVRQHVQVLQARIVPDDKPVGDVDAVLIVGDTAFVLECRTLKNAATPYEYWDVANDLNDKESKALRKRDYLRNNQGWLEATAARQGITLKHPIKRYVAVVVSNSYMFEGCRDVEPYYVQVDTLLNAILTGGPRFGDVIEGKEVEYMVDYFGSFADPAEAMLRAVASPAKAEMYRLCIQPGKFPIPGVAEGDHYGAVRQWVLNFPKLGHIRSLLDQCSFAPMLKQVPLSRSHYGNPGS